MDAVDTVGSRAPRGEDHDWDLRTLANDPHQGQPVEFGKHQVEDDQPWLRLRDGRQRGPTISRCHDGKSLTFEIGANKRDDLRIVIDYEDWGGGHAGVILKNANRPV